MSHNPWYANGLRFECQRCGECCTHHGEYAYVYLSRAEGEAIAAHLGLSHAAFETRYCTEEDGWTVLRMDRPECPFLTAGRSCAIYPVRPVQCATWPFWRDNLQRETWEGVVARTCPGVGVGELHSRDEIERLAELNEAAAQP
jgi:uncharacterized protein